MTELAPEPLPGPAANPILPGSNPDPSIVAVDGVYYVVTSSFEYLPGLPVYRSTDLVEWEHIGHVATRPEQVQLDDVPTPGGVWAPTIRHHDGLFHVIVSVFLGGRGCVVFTAEDPAGPWSDGVVIDVVGGIDPDLAWDDEGTAYVSYAQFGRGILQVRVDLATGLALEEPRLLWAGTGLLGTEGPHLYRRGDYWYLLVAEGGTDRGHAVSVARGPSPAGPFESCPHNQVLSARSTASPVQNVRHADLVDAPDGGIAAVCLGVRPVDASLAFSPLGRETFLVRGEWVDGWPTFELPALGAPTPDESFRPDLHDGGVLDDLGWVAVRRTPSSVASVVEGALSLAGDAEITDAAPAFLGRRQRHHDCTFEAVVDVAQGRGGVAARLREDHVVLLEAAPVGDHVVVTARAVLSALEQSWTAELPAGTVRLGIETTVLPVDLRRGQLGGERIVLSVDVDGVRRVLADLDGRYWSYETAKGFTGRVLGVYSAEGLVRVVDLVHEGRSSVEPPDATLE